MRNGASERCDPSTHSMVPWTGQIEELWSLEAYHQTWALPFHTRHRAGGRWRARLVQNCPTSWYPTWWSYGLLPALPVLPGLDMVQTPGLQESFRRRDRLPPKNTHSRHELDVDDNFPTSENSEPSEQRNPTLNDEEEIRHSPNQVIMRTATKHRLRSRVARLSEIRNHRKRRHVIHRSKRSCRFRWLRCL